MKDELNQIQWLRGIAALLVVFTHFSGKAFSVNLLGFQFSKGSIGVDIFFIISGFIMMYVASRKKQVPLSFLRNRALRILPLHYLFLIPLYLVYIFKPEIINSSVDVTYVWQSFLLIPMARENAEYLNPVIWTLCYEVMFYIIFSASLCFSSLYKSFIFTSIVIILISVLGWFYRDSGAFVTAVTDSISLEFVMGMFLFILYKKGFLSVNPFIPFIISIVSYVIFYNIELPRFVKDGIPSAFMFIFFINLPNVKIVFLNYLGKVSYEIYVCHIMCISLSYLILNKLGVHNLYVFFVLTFTIILVVSYVVSVILSRKKKKNQSAEVLNG